MQTLACRCTLARLACGVILSANLILLTPAAFGQHTAAPPGTLGEQVNLRVGITIRFTVLDQNKKAIKEQALIRLTDHESGRTYFRSTQGSEAEFLDMTPATYLVEVGAAGYLGWHAQIKATDNAHDVIETVMLSLDPAAVDLRLDDSERLPSKARKEAEKGIQELQLSNFADARKHLESANRRYPNSSSINFLLGYLAFQERDQEHALSFLATSTKLNRGNIQAQNLLAQIYYRRGDFAPAAEAAQTVVNASGESLIARKILANSCLKLKEFDKARENAEWIVEQGGSESAEAQLLVGQALAGSGKREEAVRILTGYLNRNPGSAVAPQLRELISQIAKQSATDGNGEPALAIADADSIGGASFAANAGMPSDVDSQQPSLVPGVTCPANLLEETGLRSKQLIDSVARFSAIEHMIHENLSAQGTPRNRQTRQYNYIVSINEASQGPFSVQEYRDSGNLDMPEKITTSGLPVLAIAFHPLFQPDFEMQCEGLGNWNHQPTWLVHFRQADGKPSRLRSYVVNKTYYPVNLKGRAWIQADNFQIVHLETDLVQGIPEVHLFTEHTTVDYGPVAFERNQTELWLPKAADMYVHIGKARFRRSESFDHFMLFATDATEKTKVPSGDATQRPPASSSVRE